MWTKTEIKNLIDLVNYQIPTNEISIILKKDVNEINKKINESLNYFDPLILTKKNHIDYLHKIIYDISDRILDLKISNASKQC